MNLFDLMATLSLDSSSYEKGLDNAEKKANSLGSSLKNGFSAAINVATKALAAATTAAVGFAASSVTAGAEFDKAMSQVVSTMGYSVEDLNDETTEASSTMQNLRNFALEMGRTTKFSAVQAAEALNYMALAGYNAETSMNMLPTVLNLAAAGGIDLAYASDMVTDAQTALGLNLSQTTNLVDEMAMTASKSNTSVAQLGEAILTIGGTAQFMSGGTTELNQVLGILADNGIKASEAGTHLRNMLLKLSSPTEAGALAMEILGVKVFDAEGNMRAFSDIFLDMQNSMLNVTDTVENAYKKVSAWRDLFDDSEDWFKFTEKDNIQEWLNVAGISILNAQGELREWEDIVAEINKLYKDGEMSQKAQIGYLSTIFNTRDVASATALLNTNAERWNELNGYIKESAYDLETVRKKVDEAGISWDKYGPKFNVIKNGVDGLTDVILDDLVRQGLSVEEATEHIAEEYNISMRDARKAVGSVASALNEAEGAAAQMAKTMEDNLLGDITLFKSALEGAKVAISDELTPSLRDFVQFGTDAISGLTDAFEKEGLTGAMAALGDIIAQGTALLIEKVPEAIEMGLALLNALIQGIIENLPQLADAAIEIISTIGTAMITNGPLLLESFGEVMGQIVGKIIDPETLTGFIGGVVELITTMATAFIDNMPTILDSIIVILSNLVITIQDNLPLVIGAAIQILNALIQGLSESLPTLIKYVPALVLAIASVILENLPTIIDSALEIILALVDGLLNNLPAIMDAVLKILDGFVEKIRENLPMIIEAAIQILEALIQGLLDDMPQLIAFIKEIIYTISDVIFDNLPEIIDAGMEILMALVDGLLDNLPQIIRTTMVIIHRIAEAVRENLDVIIPAAIQIIVAIIEGLGQALPQLISYLPVIINTITGILMDNFPLILEAGINLLMTLAQGILNNLPEIIRAITVILTGVLDYILDNLPEFLQMGMELLRAIIYGILDNLPEIMTAIGELIFAFIGAIGEHLPEIIEQGISLVIQLIIGLISAIPDLIGAAGQLIESLWNAFINTDWGEIGRNLIEGLKNGFLGQIENVKNALKDGLSHVMGGIKSFFGIQSPSKVFRDEIGKMLGIGLAEGIEDSTGDVIDSATDMAKSVLDTMDGMNAELANDAFDTLGNTLATESMYGRASGVTINVYGAEGQNVSELAEIISQKLAFETQREMIAWA